MGCARGAPAIVTGAGMSALGGGWGGGVRRSGRHDSGPVANRRVLCHLQF